jgi:hypothetical protein
MFSHLQWCEGHLYSYICLTGLRRPFLLVNVCRDGVHLPLISFKSEVCSACPVKLSFNPLVDQNVSYTSSLKVLQKVLFLRKSHTKNLSS